MALQVKVGSFAKSIAAATASQAVTGVGFQPVGLILFMNALTSSTFSNTVNLQQGMGFTDGTNSFVTSIGIQDNSAAPATNARRTSGICIQLISGTASGVVAEASLTSFDSDGFTLSWTTNDANADLIGYIAIGGSSVSCKVGTNQFPAATGDLATTGVGFQPKAVLLLTGARGTVLSTANTATTFSFGAYDGTTGVVLSAGVKSASTSGGQRGQNSTKVLHQHNSTTPSTLDATATGVSLDSDGFTINFGAVSTRSHFGFMAIGGAGVNAKVGVETAKTTTGTQAKTGVGFQPSGLFINSWCRTANAALQFDPFWSIGAADGSSNVQVGAQDISTNPTKTALFTDVTKLVQMTNADSAPAVVGTLSSFDSDGFTINYTAVSGTADEFWYLALGAAGGGATAVPVFMNQYRQRWN